MGAIPAWPNTKPKDWRRMKVIESAAVETVAACYCCFSANFLHLCFGDSHQIPSQSFGDSVVARISVENLVPSRRPGTDGSIVVVQQEMRPMRAAAVHFL